MKITVEMEGQGAASEQKAEKQDPMLGKKLTAEECKDRQCVIYEEGAYDVSSYAAKHPGGMAVLSGRLGEDITDDFEAIGHSAKAREILKSLFVAEAIPDEESAKKRRKYWTVPLKPPSSRELAASIFELTFAWEPQEETRELAPGRHVKLTVKDASTGQSSSRSYTPVTFDAEARSMTLGMKFYEKGEMSQLLRRALATPTMDDFAFSMTGPLGEIMYNEKELVYEDIVYSSSEHLVLIAGGTGITPFVALLRAKTLASKKVTLLYCAGRPEELMYEEELRSQLSSENQELKILCPSAAATLANQVVEAVSASTSPGANVACVICGPPPMEKALQSALAAKGYSQVLASTTGALGGQKQSGWMAENPYSTMFLGAIAVVIPAVIMNEWRIPSSWPHYAAMAPNAVGFDGAYGGKFEINGFVQDVTEYAYVLADPTAAEWWSPWIGYAIHQTLTILVLARAFVQQPKYSMEFRWFNREMLAVQVFGAVLKYVQQVFFYNGLSEVLSLGFGVSTVFLYYVIIIAMYIPTRGLFFGYGDNWSWTKECTTFLRKYHGFFIGFFIVNDFWYHPFESTLGHLTGIFNDAMIMCQMVCIYMPIHLNKYWCCLIESWVILHAFLIPLNRGPATSSPEKIWFAFAYCTIFVVSQMHGLGWSRAFRAAIAFVYLAAMLIVYGFELEGPGIGLSKIFTSVILRIPFLTYIVIFFGMGFFWVCNNCCVKKAQSKVTRSILATVFSLICVTICFQPLMLIFLIL